MKIGLFGIGSGPCGDAAVARDVARAAEDAGFESLWTGEHVVLPDPQVPPSPAPPEFPMLHPSTILAHLAAVTDRVLLGTGIVLLPQRNPVVLAKELASLDVVSGGRLLFGLGVGYLEAEFDALGVPFAGRGARADEYLEAMKTLWTQEKPAFKGRFVSFEGVQSRPRPIQQPHPPVIVGGMSASAYRRAVSKGNGWYGFALDEAGTEDALAGLREAAEQVERPEELGPPGDLRHAVAAGGRRPREPPRSPGRRPNRVPHARTHPGEAALLRGEPGGRRDPLGRRPAHARAFASIARMKSVLPSV